MTTVLLLGSLQSWFLVLLLAAKRDKGLPDRALAVWLGLIGTHLAVLLIDRSWGPLPAPVLQLNAAFPFLQGPLLYVYVDLLTARRPRLRRAYLWHALPFAVFVLYLTIGFDAAPAAGPEVTRYRHLLSLRNSFLVWLLCSVPLYILISMILLRRFRERLVETRSNVDRIHLSWLRLLVAGMGAVWVAVIVTALLQWLNDDPVALRTVHLVFPALTLFVYAIGYFGFSQTAIFSGAAAGTSAGEGPSQNGADDAGVREEVEEVDSLPHPAMAAATPKYHKSGLGPKEADRLHERLLELMRAERPYLDPDLTLGELAASLESPSNHVSQVINELDGLSFYDFVNRYRVDEAAARLDDPTLADATVLEIAFDSGFGSKSTFNRIFRERTGTTPSEFRSGSGGSDRTADSGPSG